MLNKYSNIFQKSNYIVLLMGNNMSTLKYVWDKYILANLLYLNYGDF